MWEGVAIALTVVAALALIALVTRYVVLQLAYGRRVVIVPGVGAMIIAAVAVVVAVLTGGAGATIAIAMGAVAVVVLSLRLWMVFGASTDLILDQGELVARGLLMTPRRADRRIVIDPPGTGGVAVVAGGGPVQILRVPSARRDRKSLLFAQGLAKFLATADRGASR